MTRTHRLGKLAPLGCATLVLLTLSSCALPPKQAWQKIRHDGLFAYISYEMRTPRRPLDAPGPVKPVGPASKPPASSQANPRPMLAQELPAPKQDEANKPAPLAPLSSPESTRTALPVPGLPGYVRSPYTNPPRLIDVRSSAPGSTMVCPYTQKPFLVPAPVSDLPAPSLVNKAPAKPDPSPAEAPKEKPASGTPLAISTPPAPEKEKEKTPASPTPQVPSSPPASGNVATTPPGPPLPKPTTPPAPAEPEIPYGTPVAGRPGYVNSPYAAPHQLVDVSDLPVGMEVKCPYTGKLFRVPPQDVASRKPAPATEGDPAKK